MTGLIIELLAFTFGSLFAFFLFWLELPGAKEKKTGRYRSLYQRWQRASTQTRAELYGGIVLGCIAIYVALQVFGVLPRP
ncbi:MAG: hypothetical protein Q4P66_07350 [Actinomycetaceae bacterium]|nr:hypothetical protein [Actinomycetaceae bacterium]